jgi:hypothetical protein
MQKPYIKKLYKIGKFTVWVVDGNYIRKYIEKEFTNCGQPLRFKKIPKWELWLDKEYAPGEERFYTDYILAEWKYVDMGLKYEDALKKANIIEKRERAKSKMGILAKTKKRAAHKKIYKQKLKSYSKGVDVWIVNGEMVRDLFYIDFTEGGHDLVYDFVPNGEVWIDDDIGPKERKYIIFHEIFERCLMINGKNYNEAHKAASCSEYKGRHNAAFFKKNLNDVFKKTQKLKMCYNKSV